MIRDPSDGSVKSSKGINPASNEINAIRPKKLEEGITVSGLRAGSTKPENIARLEKSREWLRDYLKDRDA
jgi:hypothetical protein